MAIPRAVSLASRMAAASRSTASASSRSSRIVRDRLWIGSTAGLHRLRVTTIANLTPRDGLSSDNVYPMLRDRQGAVWIGTHGCRPQSIRERARDALPHRARPAVEQRHILVRRSIRPALGRRPRTVSHGWRRPLPAVRRRRSPAVVRRHGHAGGPGREPVVRHGNRGLVRRQGDRFTTYTEAAEVWRAAGSWRCSRTVPARCGSGPRAG